MTGGPEHPEGKEDRANMCMTPADLLLAAQDIQKGDLCVVR
jgi:hypothetical protein